MDLSNKVFDLCGSNGFYVDCGANDGVSQSNTFRLEKEKGWKGLLIDASQVALNKAWEARNHDNVFIHRALSNKDDELVMGDFAGDLRGSVGGFHYGERSQVKTATLTSLLRLYGVRNVDLFSLDIEGHEMEALLGLDFNYCRPKMLVIEVWERQKPYIFAFMAAKGYKEPVNLSNWNLENNPAWNGLHNDYLFV